MRDPLQKNESPYEILKVSDNAEKKEIDAAFKSAIKTGRNIKELTDAWRTLGKAVERGLTDVFLFNKSFIKQLTPNLEGNSSLLLNKRDQITNEWKITQKRLFPHASSTHSLALCCYRWAVYLEEEQLAALEKEPFPKEDSLPESPPLEELWSDTIAFWVFLINSDEFWQEWRNSQENFSAYLSSDNDINLVRQRLESHFVNRFHSLGEKYMSHGDKASAARFREYELFFVTEMKTAKRLKETGLQLTRGGKRFVISCGQIMLQKLGILENIQKQLEVFIKSRPRDAKLQELAASLSPYANISILIDNKKFEDAIKAITSLPPEQQKKTDVLRLLAKAYLEKGKQDFSLNQFDKALDNWKKGLATGELKQDIQKTMQSECKAKATSLQRSDPETAIKLMEKALKIAPNKDLNLTLAEILAQAGIGKVLEIQKKLKKAKKKHVTQPMIKTIEKGVSYLEKAKRLGSKRAAENLPQAKAFLEQAKHGFLDLDPEVEGLIQQAQNAAKANNWNSAINLLVKAKRLADQGSHKTINKMLSQFYNARAVKNINAFMAKIGPIMKQHQELAPHLMENFIMGKPIPSHLMNPFISSLTKNLPDINTTGKSSKKKSKISWGFIIISVMAVLAFIFFGGKIKAFLGPSDKLGKVIESILYIVLTLIILSPLISRFFQWISESIKQALKPITIPPPGGYGYDSRPPCFKCSNKASYSYNVPNFGKVDLCSTHADQLKMLIEFVPSVNSGDKILITSAEKDLSKALELDPGLSAARKNLSEIRTIRTRFKI
jgi:tetratricopeptide (TPR) repeat protein